MRTLNWKLAKAVAYTPSSDLDTSEILQVLIVDLLLHLVLLYWGQSNVKIDCFTVFESSHAFSYHILMCRSNEELFLFWDLWRLAELKVLKRLGFNKNTMSTRHESRSFQRIYALSNPNCQALSYCWERLAYICWELKACKISWERIFYLL